MTTLCLIVIGHVDHGKTSLVHALTGTMTDRLAEEQARGMSIVLGFAHREYAAGTVDFIDAPGHVDFIRTMVAGASGANAALLVVSATEGVAAQTLEHLPIAGLLGIRRIVVAVTRCDLVPGPERAGCIAGIRAALAMAGCQDAPLIACSSVTGEGLEQLHGALAGLVAAAEPPAGPGGAFLAVDRAFSLQGRGTVVTGTLAGGPLEVGERCVLLPQGHMVHLRGLHSRGAPLGHVSHGMRCAANLRGVGPDDIAPGSVLCRPDAFAPSRVMDVALTALPDLERPLRHGEEVRLLCGTASVVASLRLFGAPRLEAGQEGFAQLRLARDAVAFAGQHAILRRLSPSATVAGLRVLDPVATATRPGDTSRVAVLAAARSGDLRGLVTTMAAAAGGVVCESAAARLARLPAAARVLARVGSGFVQLPGIGIAPETSVAQCRTDLLGALDRYHADHPLELFAPGASALLRGWSADLLGHVCAGLVADGLVRMNGARLMRAGRDPIADLDRAHRARLDRIEGALRDGGVVPPLPEDLLQDATERALLDLLVDTGRAVLLRNVAQDRQFAFHADAIGAARVALAAAFPPPAEFRTGEARTALGTSRRFIVPLLEHFDAVGATRRRGDIRALPEAPQ